MPPFHSVNQEEHGGGDWSPTSWGIHTRRVLRSCRVTDEEGTEASLLQKLCSLPFTT